MEKISQALTRLFDKYRIVFWYDEKKELRGAFESLLLPGVESMEIKNNEFGVKYHILREKPNHVQYRVIADLAGIEKAAAKSNSSSKVSARTIPERWKAAP